MFRLYFYNQNLAQRLKFSFLKTKKAPWFGGFLERNYVNKSFLKDRASGISIVGKN